MNLAFSTSFVFLISAITVHSGDGKRRSGSFASQGGNSPVFAQSKIELAVAQYQPLILCRILSSAESGQETRSYKTEYSIQVLAATAAFESQRKSIWSYGGASLEKGIYLVMLGVGGRIDSSISMLDGNEKSGLDAFNEVKSRMDGIKTKFLPLESFRLANDGKVDLILAKVVKRNQEQAKKGSHYSMDILKILSGKEMSEVHAFMEGPDSLTVASAYFIDLDRNGKSPRIATALKSSPEEIESLTNLYLARMGFLKEPWSRKYAVP